MAHQGLDKALHPGVRRLNHAEAADDGDDDESNPFVMLSKATEVELPGVLSEVRDT